ncbi:ribokinase [Aquibacillus koreensis]|uniref:Ribokinase n=1 Tax=Aquibacillus koreensis TaxID=279446 RepID=A0A9X3WMU8_9BACI|nr:ribokinase [Aquibacillus koreensis]MCT2534433.1 ribokinase [Aquibacillus koreensis]MDC3421740.1 ribokinase [Aquibacillus koreensis]
MAKKIVVIGSLNMDVIVSASRMPKTGETIHGEKVRYLPGGKGANQAVAIRKLGGDVTMIGAVGEDQFAQQILKQLEAYQLDTKLVSQIPGVATGIANIVHVPQDNSIIVIPGANGQCTPALLQDLEEVIASADFLLMQLEIPLETVTYALKMAKEHQVTTILNPAPAVSLSEEVMMLVDYITPNETELEVLLNEKASLEQAFTSWYQSYQTELIVTLGEKGCAYYDQGEVVTIPASKVADVTDTTGAGDAFNGAVAYGLAQDWEMAKIIAFAIQVSGLAVTKFGAQEGMPYKEEVDRLNG